MNDAAPTCGWNEAAPIFPGKDCQCGAFSESECGCDADWTPKEVYRLKLEIAALKNRLIEVVSIARQGRYSTMDFVAVGKRLDAIDDYLANKHTNNHPKYGGTELL